MVLISKHWCLQYIFTKVKCLTMKHWAISVSAWAGVEQIPQACCLFILIMCQGNALSFHLIIFWSCSAIRDGIQLFIFSVVYVFCCCFNAFFNYNVIENVQYFGFFLIIFPPFHVHRTLFSSSSSTWWASHLRPRRAPARLPRWPRPRPPFILSANRPSPLHTWSRSGPSTLRPPPRLRKYARRAGTSSSTPPTQTSAAVSRSFARHSSSRRRSSRNRRSCWWQTARLLGFHTRPAPPKRTRARRLPERCPPTPRPRTPRSLHSHSCSRHSSTCWNQAINRSRSCLLLRSR